MVAWFSQKITVGTSEYTGKFLRKKMKDGYAFTIWPAWVTDEMLHDMGKRWLDGESLTDLANKLKVPWQTLGTKLGKMGYKKG